VKFNAREKKLFDSFAKLNSREKNRLFGKFAEFFKISLSVYVTKYSDVRI